MRKCKGKDHIKRIQNHFNYKKSNAEKRISSFKLSQTYPAKVLSKLKIKKSLEINELFSQLNTVPISKWWLHLHIGIETVLSDLIASPFVRTGS